MNASHLLLAVAAFALAWGPARADETSSSVKFSDPSHPGTLKVTIARGSIRIDGADTADVTVKANGQHRERTARTDGLRVLTESSGFALTEKDNVATLDATPDGWSGDSADFRVTIPRNTNVIVSNSMGGDITCTAITGDVEIRSLNGRVRLENLSGGALVSTNNGGIEASYRELAAGKPLSFVSTNGAIVLRVPGNSKANVRLRTHNGTILTDFDEKALVTRLEAAPRGHGLSFGGGTLTPEAQEAIRQAAQAGVEMARRFAEAGREVAEAARSAAEEAKDRATDAREHARSGDDNAPFVPAIPPIVIPTMTGGKLVTGTLNGGGSEITASTNNGDITLRRLEK